MDYTGMKCPVCEKEFLPNDDIVVCPECGTPHHRTCYEETGHCFFEDKHGEDFSFEEKEGSDEITCPSCGTKNSKNHFFCSNCGAPLNIRNNNAENNTNPFQNAQGFGGAPFSTAFDPMGGVNPDQEMGDGVKAGEISKFVGRNTPYFLRVFSNIKNFGKSKFNFCAFFFSGFYLFYRKMYKLGALMTSVMLMLITTVYVIQNTAFFKTFVNRVQATDSGAFGFMNTSEIMKAYYSLSPAELSMVTLASFCFIAAFALQIIIGIFANRWYFSHCKKQIKNLKDDDSVSLIEEKGGVNLGAAICAYSIGLLVITAAIFAVSRTFVFEPYYFIVI